MVTVKSVYERLGNSMFQIAAGVGYAKEIGQKFVLPSEWKYSKYLEKPIPYINETLSNPITLKTEAIHYTQLPHTTGENIILDGYMQSDKYFRSVDCDELFKPSDSFHVYSVLKTSQIDNFSYNKLCCIHLRFGDYLNLKEYHTPLTETSYYKDAIKRCHFYSDTQYVIFSDDYVLAKKYIEENFSDDRISVYFANEIINYPEHMPSEIVDLYCMSTFPFIITANSTFSWWAAYLNKKNIISTYNGKLVAMPKNWLGEEYIKQGWHSNDLYFKGVKVI